MKVMSAAEYHAHPAMSCSKLKNLAASPAHYKWSVENPEKTTAAMSFGSAAHAICLERETFDAQVFVSTKNRKTKGFEEDCLFNPGRIVVTQEEMSRLPQIQKAWDSSDTVRDLLEGGLVERSFFWKDSATGVECKSRLDIYNPARKIVVDLKTTEDASHHVFAYDAAKYLYHWQAAMYLNAVHAVTGEAPEYFEFVVIEKEPPFGLMVYRVNSIDVAKGQAGITKALATYAACLKSNQWTGYPDTVADLSLPGWAP